MAGELLTRKASGLAVLAHRPRRRQTLGDVELDASGCPQHGAALLAHHAGSDDAETACGVSLQHALVPDRACGIGVHGAKVGQVDVRQRLGSCKVEATECVALRVGGRSEQRDEQRDQ